MLKPSQESVYCVHVYQSSLSTEAPAKTIYVELDCEVAFFSDQPTRLTVIPRSGHRTGVLSTILLTILHT